MVFLGFWRPGDLQPLDIFIIFSVHSCIFFMFYEFHSVGYVTLISYITSFVFCPSCFFCYSVWTVRSRYFVLFVSSRIFISLTSVEYFDFAVYIDVFTLFNILRFVLLWWLEISSSYVLRSFDISIPTYLIFIICNIFPQFIVCTLPIA